LLRLGEEHFHCPRGFEGVESNWLNLETHMMRVDKKVSCEDRMMETILDQKGDDLSLEVSPESQFHDHNSSEGSPLGDEALVVSDNSFLQDIQRITRHRHINHFSISPEPFGTVVMCAWTR
jgi:stress-induced morphogen